MLIVEPNQSDPIDAALTRRAEVESMLARLQARSDALFEKRPSDISWADVGKLDRLAGRLREVCEAIPPDE